MQIFKKCFCFFVLSLMLVSANAETQTVTIDFDSPEKFTDFKTEISLRAKDREKLMKQLTKLMTSSIEKHFKNGQSMKMVVYNVDMAGSFLLGGGDLVRTVREGDRIRFEFSYSLFDSDGKTIKQDNVNLTSRDAKPISRVHQKYRHTHFTHEMPLFDDWLKTL